MKRFLGTLLVIGSVGGGIFAQNMDFDEWKKQRDAEFKKFKDERDRQFAEFLRKRWEDFHTFRGEEPFSNPKPNRMPKYDEKTKKSTPQQLPVKDITKPLPPVPHPPKPIGEPSEPQPELPEFKEPYRRTKSTEPFSKPTAPQEITEAPTNLMQASTTFFDINIPITYDKRYPISLKLPVNESNIAAYWETISNTDFQPLLQKFQEHRQKMRLGDYGYYRLVRTTAEKIHRNINDINMFCWFMMIKSGYRCKIGFNENTVYLLLPFDGTVYAINYFKLDNATFYCMSPQLKENSRLYIYSGDYPGATQHLTLQIPQTMRFNDNYAVRTLKFTYQDKEYQFNVRYENSTIKYFYEYPQGEFSIYLDAPVDANTETDLLNAIRPHIVGKNEYDAVSFILAFVQFAFDYATDDEQFKREKPLFVEETIRYPFSDCEDRSILYAFLVRKLVGLDVVAVHYPGHLACATAFNFDVSGDYFILDGKKYVVTDPTYIGAPIGMQMPQFQGVEVKLIKTKKL
ncbi:MAG: hypothetical protein NZM38_06260 [Cytophagales bacterium]|nr:hypothetical protein [Cytophagales bacterium]MDW8384358.1 hypothetical protein [Flammeovirgaceae bacterium]